jgi:hypothetical protein
MWWMGVVFLGGGGAWLHVLGKDVLEKQEHTSAAFS